MTEDFLPYGTQTITSFDRKAVDEALQQTIITRGEKVEAFEQAVADYCGVEFSVAFSSGTAALQAAYYAAELSPHDRIVTTPNSFIATSIGAVCGASVDFVDIDCGSGGIDLAKVEERLNLAMTRGRTFFVPVHFAGVPLDMQKIDQMVRDPDQVTIEDAAHAIGSCYPSGEKVGSCLFSDMTTFSFHPVKTLTTGEGGMVTTHDAKLYERLKLFRNNGMVRVSEKGSWYYEVQELTGNYNMTDFQAALGLSQLKRLDDVKGKRRVLVEEYRRTLEDCRLFDARYDSYSCYHLMVAQIDFEKANISRQQIMDSLKERGIGTQVHYIPLYYHPVFSKRERWQERCPQMETYYSQALTLPLFPEMNEADVGRVSQALADVRSLVSCKP
jgi:UDP-4-amino-4,6-dideoxy-L-N-acetyl-beta-L-altrosamine transaminase